MASVPDGGAPGGTGRGGAAREATARARRRHPSPIAAVLVLAVLAAVALAGLAGGPRRTGRAGERAGSQPAPRPGSVLPAPVTCSRCWRPPLRESWQIQLSSVPAAPFPRVGMIEVDGFDTPASVVAALHRSRRGRGVVCYIDAGTWERWRPDAARFPRSLLGRPVAGWPGERWLDIARFRGGLGRIMLARARMCQRKGFDAVDFDNVDGYASETGFRLTQADQLRYDAFLANAAHRLGLAVALKNDLPQIPALLRYFDFAVAEQCFQYAECLSSQNGGYGLDQFVRAGKAVFDIEYHLRLSRFCPAALRYHFNALRKRLSLGAWREPCE